MKKGFSLILLIIISTAFAGAQNIINHEAISFKIKNLGIYINGTIAGLQANVHFDPNNLSSSVLAASVDVNTLNTDNSSRDEDLKSDNFFDLVHYPKIIMKSVSFKHRNGNNYTGMFNLTIKNKTKLMAIPFTCINKGNAIIFNSTFKLNRRDFGVGGNSLIMSDEVLVTIDAEAVE